MVPAQNYAVYHYPHKIDQQQNVVWIGETHGMPDPSINPNMSLNKHPCQRCDYKDLPADFQNFLEADYELTQHQRDQLLFNEGVLIPRKEYACARCGRSYNRPDNLTRHRKYECGIAPRFKCNYCEHRSRYKAQIEGHIKRMHRDKALKFVVYPYEFELD
ncbi:hypothetical protein QAD02_022635 [Eretmocerus hayati]|uniref:Uncharacterized protein n=1 Tax=Eretmocerus hayati TaxID=131215 RepID=A0ACC2PTJ4_9HYME|nr:hypothetical protein QAD02_022635 [Eretmocerus hayati]